jgi:hypothetical protein
MYRKQIALSVVVALGLAAPPLSGAEAHRHHGFPLFLPFIAAGAIVGTAAAIAAAPFQAVATPAPYYYGAPASSYYAPPPAYYAPGYYQQGYNQPGYYPGY